MSKFLFFSDPHFHNKNPINRIDNLLETALNKMKWIFEYADQNRISYIICGGDIFHRPSPSDEVANKVAKIFAKYADTQKIFYLIGNHECIGNNVDTINRCKIGMFKHYPNIQFIGDHPIEFDDCILCGYNFSKENECPEVVDPVKDFNLDLKKGKKIICVVHSMIVDDKTIIIDGIRKTIHWDSIMTTADVVLTGHYHPGFGIKESKFGSYFVNPGAMVRTDASKTDINREPQIAVIKIKNGDLKIKLEMIPHIKDVFNIKDFGVLQTAEDEKLKFIEALQSMSNEELMSSNVLDILDNISKNKTKELEELVSNKVVDMCRRKIKGIMDE
jgi:DNA repair exonuclease SbcCD nuclease subunit